ncbi:MAG: hypothetical protein WD355_02920 [Balneolaceae bacterium]
MKSLIQYGTLVLLILLLGRPVSAQVTISPTAVFLDSNSKVGSLFVANPTSNPIEIQLGFEFAYPRTNENGSIVIYYEDEEAEEKFSLVPYLRAFPTTFTLQPNQRQTIRLLANMPADSENALYWTRMRISSSQLTPPIGEVAEGELATQVTMQIDQVIPVLVHHGETNTGLTIHDTSFVQNESQGQIFLDVERSGNSPFIGRAVYRITDSSGSVMVDDMNSTSVYFRNNHRIQFDISDWPAGEYRAEITFESARSDIRPTFLAQIEPVSETVTFTIN